MIVPKQVVLTKTELLGRLFVICKLTIVAALIISCSNQKKKTAQVLINQADSLIHDSRVKVKNLKELEQNIVKASGLLKKAWLIDSKNYVLIQCQVITYTLPTLNREEEMSKMVGF